MAIIKYNGSTVANLAAGQTATLKCEGKKMNGDVVVVFGADGHITYNGITTEVEGGKTATLQCAGKKMASDVVVMVQKVPDSEVLTGNFISFDSPSGFTLATNNATKNWDGTLEYSTDTNTWNEWDGATTLSADSGRLYLRGTGNSKITTFNLDGKWVISGTNVACRGNIENLLNYLGFKNRYTFEEADDLHEMHPGMSSQMPVLLSEVWPGHSGISSVL